MVVHILCQCGVCTNREHNQASKVNCETSVSTGCLRDVAGFSVFFLLRFGGFKRIWWVQRPKMLESYTHSQLHRFGVRPTAVLCPHQRSQPPPRSGTRSTRWKRLARGRPRPLVGGGMEHTSNQCGPEPSARTATISGRLPFRMGGNVFCTQKKHLAAAICLSVGKKLETAPEGDITDFFLIMLRCLLRCFLQNIMKCCGYYGI